MHLTRVAALAVALAMTAGSASAQEASGTFSGVGYEDWNAEYGFGNGYIWHTGDYWQKTTSATGLSSVTALGLHLSFTNGVAAGYSQVFAIMVNGTSVGAFLLGASDTGYEGFLSWGLPISAFAGDEYTIRIEQTSSDIPSGEGATLLLHESEYNMRGEAAVAPEPATILLMISGLAGLGGLGMFRRECAA